MPTADIPFYPFDASFRDVVRDKYVAGVASWLLGDDPNSMTVMRGNNAWTTAIGLEFLTNALDVLSTVPQHNSLCASIAHKRILGVRWLVEQHRAMSEGWSWDGATWDTGVIVRTLSVVEPFLPVTERDQAQAALVCGARWLASKFEGVEYLKYPYGSADCARILGALVVILQRQPTLYAQIDSSWSSTDPRRVPRLLQRIAEYLLRSCTSVPNPNGASGTVSALAFWEDGFNTSEVVEVLAAYYQFLGLTARHSDTPSEEQSLCGEWRTQLRHSLSSAYQWFESKFLPEGIWESPVNTARILKAYLEAPTYTGSEPLDTDFLSPQVHMVFKSLRWLCDQNQTYADGSLQHSDLLTAFYAPALLDICKYWGPAQKTVAEVYDDVVWASPMRSSDERSQRLALAIQVLERDETIEMLRDEGRILSVKEEVWRHRTSGVLRVTAFTALFTVLTIVSAVDLGLVSISVAESQVGNVLQFLGVALTVYIAVSSVILAASRVSRRDQGPSKRAPKLRE